MSDIVTQDQVNECINKDERAYTFPFSRNCEQWGSTCNMKRITTWTRSMACILWSSIRSASWQRRHEIFDNLVVVGYIITTQYMASHLLFKLPARFDRYYQSLISLGRAATWEQLVAIERHHAGGAIEVNALVAKGSLKDKGKDKASTPSQSGELSKPDKSKGGYHY